MRPEEIRPLTTLRFVGAMAVFVGHLPFLPDDISGWWSNTLLVANAFGTIAVGFFFVLSGYILAYIYAGRVDGFGAPATANYLAGRIAKIYPLHLATLLLWLPLEWLASKPLDVTLVKIAVVAPLLQAFVPHPSVIGALNLPSWSLSDEMFFYLLFPLLIPLVMRASRRTAVVAVLAIAALGCASAMALRGLTPAYEAWIATLPAGWDAFVQRLDLLYWLTYMAPFTRVLDFIAGLLLFRALGGLGKPGFALASAAEIGIVALIVAVIGFWGTPGDHHRLVAGFMPTAIAVAAIFALDAGILSRALSWGPLLYLGRVSFAIYMVHYVVFGYARPFLPTGTVSSATFLAWSAGLLAVTLAASVLLYHLVELPMQRRARDLALPPIRAIIARWTNRRAPAAIRVAPAE
ncbi:MAG: acyltransferase [Rhodospirillales bacterium]|nr:MAG: acyltransferase [Rhodospirillales bacterium]